MKKDSLSLIIAAVLVVAIGGVFVFATLGGDSENGDMRRDMSESQSGSVADSNLPSMDEAEETDAVEIKSFAFGPQAIKVKAGTKVTWTNQDSVKHNAVKDDGQSDGPDGPLLAKGESYSYTYEKPGTYSYHCAPHISMKGVVYVTE